MPLRDNLQELALALKAGGEVTFAEAAELAAAGSDEQLKSFLTSNDLWGGAGSVADQAGLGPGDRSPHRRRIEAALVALGREQLKTGMTNVRTEMWVSAYEEWARRGI